MWISAEVPGSGQLREFYKPNAGNFPRAAMPSGGNASMQKAMADVQRKMASIQGAPVQQIVRMKSPLGSGAAMPQISGPQADQMAQTRAKLEALVAQGVPEAVALKQAFARMPGATPATGGAGSGAMSEITVDSSDFSIAAIPDSVFAVPAGYQKGK